MVARRDEHVGVLQGSADVIEIPGGNDRDGGISQAPGDDLGGIQIGIVAEHETELVPTCPKPGRERDHTLHIAVVNPVRVVTRPTTPTSIVHRPERHRERAAFGVGTDRLALEPEDEVGPDLVVDGPAPDRGHESA